MARKKRTSSKQQKAKLATTAKSAEPKVAAKKQPVTAASAKKATRKSFTPAERAKILAEAAAKSLTGKQVARLHGISMVTYYVWRKKAGAEGRSAREMKVGSGATQDLAAQLRVEVRAKIGELLPGILRAEVTSYLEDALGSRRGRSKRQSRAAG